MGDQPTNGGDVCSQGDIYYGYFYALEKRNQRILPDSVIAFHVSDMGDHSIFIRRRIMESHEVTAERILNKTELLHIDPRLG